MPDLMTLVTVICSSNESWSYPIRGSKGNIYIVTYGSTMGYLCPCKGFTFRQSCKHVEEAKKIRCGWNEGGSEYIGTTYKNCPRCDSPVSTILVGV